MKSRRLVLQSSNQIINGWVRPEPNNRTMTQRLFMGSKVLKPVCSHLFRRESKYLDGRFQVCVIKKRRRATIRVFFIYLQENFKLNTGF